MKNIKTEIKWAVIFVVASLLWMGLERFLGLHGEHIDKHSTYTMLFAIPAITIFVLALLDKRKNYYHGFMSYKQGFVSGLIITLIVAALSPLTQFITSEFISPDYFSNVIEYSVATGELERSVAEEHFNYRSYAVQAVIGAVLMGVITSAVVAIFTRRKRKGDQNPLAA